MKVILASKSPRRKEILEQLGVDFKVVVSHADETVEEPLKPEQLVKELSRRKACAVLEMLRERGESLEGVLILACDTVVCQKGKIFGKPKDREQAKEMLRCLSGTTHRVVSGITVIYEGKTESDCEETLVTFAPLSEKAIDRYVSTDEPMDKAGAYAIQGLASVWIKKIDGNYHNVVGLPTQKLRELLETRFSLFPEDWMVSE